MEHSEYLKFRSLWEIKPKLSIDDSEDMEEVALTASDVDENYQQDVSIEEEAPMPRESEGQPSKNGTDPSPILSDGK